MPRYKIFIINLDQERKLERMVETPDVERAIEQFKVDFLVGLVTPRPLTVDETALEQFGSILSSFIEGKMSLRAALDAVGEILERAAGGGIR